MGFERLCMALEGKTSNYETSVFQRADPEMERLSGKTYTNRYNDAPMSDIAMRVVADHVRAVCFAIADGSLPAQRGCRLRHPADPAASGPLLL